MPRYSAMDQFQLKVLTKAAALVMAPGNYRDVFEQFPMTVVAVRELNEHLRRITFHAPGFADYRRTGPDENFGLLMPRPGRPLVLPSEDKIQVRQAIRAMPAEQRPDARWYTVRSHRPERAEIDVDFVLHGDTGPGSRWAGAVAPGDVVGFRAGTSGYRAPGGSCLLAADETALPALASILEDPGAAEVHAFVEVPDESYRTPLPGPATWVFRGADAPGSAVVEAVGSAPAVDFAWACGESALATGVRRHLVREKKMDRRAVMFTGYWKVGSARM
ncbi:siderophore-interacting protein [Actinosynnema sp. NPDC020468]|uniref:siderophore-interacting protein n=1 Tax=Actinosynnema sp. NPDC020468 TaxID=3154488 RepID=UPI0033DA09C1